MRIASVAFATLALLSAGCGSDDIPKGRDGNTELDVYVAYCSDRIHLGETCEPLESTRGTEIYSYASFERGTPQTVTVVREIVKGGERRQETNPKVVPAGEKLLDGAQIFRGSCSELPCTIVTTAFVDGREAAAASFVFE